MNIGETEGQFKYLSITVEPTGKEPEMCVSQVANIREKSRNVAVDQNNLGRSS